MVRHTQEKYEQALRLLTGPEHAALALGSLLTLGTGVYAQDAATKTLELPGRPV